MGVFDWLSALGVISTSLLSLFFLTFLSLCLSLSNTHTHTRTTHFYNLFVQISSSLSALRALAHSKTPFYENPLHALLGFTFFLLLPFAFPFSFPLPFSPFPFPLPILCSPQRNHSHPPNQPPSFLSFSLLFPQTNARWLAA